jgi:iron complex outermembrane receptor protein
MKYFPRCLYSLGVAAFLSLSISNFSLAQSNVLKEVVVTSTKYEEDTLLVPSFINIITRDQIEKIGASSVSEAIMRLAGVPASPSLYGGNEYTLDLMGFGDTALNNTVVVIDGVPMKEGDQSEIRLGTIPIDQVERIEIQRGGSGVFYGEGATAGVIHIITFASSDESSKSNTGNLSVGAGSHRTNEIKTNANYRKDKVELGFSSQNQRSDGYRENSSNNQETVVLSLKYRHDHQNRMGVSVSRDDFYALTPGSLTVAEFDSNPKAAQASSLANQTNISVLSDRSALFWQTKWEEFLVRWDVVQRNRHLDSLGVLYGAVTPLNFDSRNNLYSFNAIRIFDTEFVQNTFSVGAETGDWVQGRIYPTKPAWGLVSLASTSSASYFKNDVDIKSADVRVSFGLRSESFDRNQLFTGVNTEMHETLQAWELGAVKKLNSESALFVRRTQNYRLPNLDELPTPVYDADLNPISLRPQRDTTNELGWKFNRMAAAFSFRIYQAKISDEITYDPLQYGNLNFPKTSRSGLDFFARLAIRNDLTLIGSYGYRVSKFEESTYSGKTLPMAPQNVLTLRADWILQPQHLLSLGMTHISKQFIAGDFDNENSMPSYRVADMRYSYKSGASDIAVVVRNLTNAKYFSYATTTGGYSVYPDNGRSLMAIYKHRF